MFSRELFIGNVCFKPKLYIRLVFGFMYLYIVGSIYTVRFAFKLIINLICSFLFNFYFLKESCEQMIAPENFIVLK